MVYFDSSTLTGMHGSGHLPQLSEFMKLRAGRETTMIHFYNNFLSCVVRKNDWKRNVTKQPVPKFTTNSDEAFALLVLENGWDEWIKIEPHEHFILKSGRNENNKHPPAVGGHWTSDAKGSTRFGGWKEEAIIRFNKLCALVEKDRAENGHFDKTYFESKSGHRKLPKKTETVIKAYDKLDNDLIAEV